MPIDNQEIITNVVSDLASKWVSSMYEGIKNQWSKSELKSQMELISAYEKYLDYSYKKNSKIKTLLYKRVPKDLYNFYESINVKKEKEVIETKDIENLLKIGQKLIITGTGGIGKTTMMKHLFLNCIDGRHMVPILIELRNLNEEYSRKDNFNLVEYIYNNLKTQDFETDQSYFEYGLKNGENLILFDGFDELKHDISRNVAADIKEFCNTYNKSYVIITSRPSEQFIGWHDFVELETVPLNKKQALSLINRLEIEEENIKKQFLKELDDKLFDKYTSFASIPLLLTIMFLTYENNATVPDKLSDFYEQAFVALYQTHDASKSGYQRDIRSKLSYEEFKNVLSYICFQTYLNDEYSFTEDKILEHINRAMKRFKFERDFVAEDYLEDLTSSVCMFIKEGIKYKFSHRTFQEFFAAVYTTQKEDNMQIKIFDLVLAIKGMSSDNQYIDMLKQLQKDRFIKNCIYSTAKHFREFSREKLLGKIFSTVMEEGDAGYSLVINDIKYYFVYREILEYINMERVGFNNNLLSDLFIKLLNKNIPEDEEFIYESGYKLSVIEDCEMFDDLALALGNIYKEVDAIMNWIDEYEAINTQLRTGDIREVLEFL